MNERRNATAFTRTEGGTSRLTAQPASTCRVRNMSPAGACLEVSSQVGIPDNFVLVVSYDKINRPCHVIWRRIRGWVWSFAPPEPRHLEPGSGW